MTRRPNWVRLAAAVVTLAVPLASGAGGAELLSQSAPKVMTMLSVTSPGGVGGTTSADIASFAAAYNAKRVANHLRKIPLSHFRYDACMEQRLFWMAEDPSSNPQSAWGHIGTVRSDGVPSVGCDGNLAGGYNNTGKTVAIKWWNSSPHRTALYKPKYKGSVTHVCIFFAMTHGGIPDEPATFTRAAARWGAC